MRNTRDLHANIRFTFILECQAPTSNYVLYTQISADSQQIIGSRTPHDRTIDYIFEFEKKKSQVIYFGEQADGAIATLLRIRLLQQQHCDFLLHTSQKTV